MEVSAQLEASLRDRGVAATIGWSVETSDASLHDLALLASQICGTTLAAASVLDPQEQWFVATVGFTVTRIPLEESLCRDVLAEARELRIVGDLAQDDTLRLHLHVAGGLGVRFYAGVPLRGPAGRLVGVLCVMDRVPRELTPLQLDQLRALARQVGNHLELRRREAVDDQLAAVLDRITDSFVELDHELRFVYLNRAALAVTGRSASDVLGVPIYEAFVIARDGPLVIAMGNTLLDHQPRTSEVYVGDLGRWFECRVYPSPRGLAVFASDLTELRAHAAEQDALVLRLRALTARLEAVREEESQRIARELHDELGQELTVMKIDLTALKRGDADGAPAKIDELLHQVDTMSQLVRRIARGLRPQALDDLGLAAAIDLHCRELARRTGIACHVDVPTGDVPIAPAAATALFRALQELLTNVVRHAEARTVFVTLAVTADGIALTVDDDGRGIPPERDRSPASLGLVGIRERMTSVGGTFSIAAAEDGGTSATLQIPRATS